MAFIPANEINSHKTGDKSHQIGDWVITTEEHEALCGKFTVGSKVQVIEIDPVRGYGIQDEYGNRIIEIGWTI